jgi:hypothetical protein
MDMDFFRIWAQRISMEIPVHVFLQNKTTGKISTQHANGTIVNLSKAGACVIFNKVILDGSHLFFTAQERAENNLYLTDFSIDEEVTDVVATTVWMDGCTYHQRPSFKIGVRFLGEQKDLFTTIKNKSH